MGTLQRKKTGVIKKGTNFSYDPASFYQHEMPNFYEIDDPQELLRLIKPFEFMGRKFITFDTETHPYFKSSHDVPKTVVRRWVGSGKHANPQDYPFCIQICDGTNSYAIYDSVENNFAKFKQLAPLFEDASIEKIAHNWKFDAHMLANIDMKIVGRVHDTVVLTKLVNENRSSFELRELAAKKKGGIVKFEYMLESYKQINKISDYRQVPKRLLTQYGCADVWNCFIVFIDEYPKLIEENLEALYDKECECMIVLYAMERYGMRTDPSYEIPLKEELQKLTDDAERAIYEEAGSIFNINSSKQLYQVLMKLGVNSSWLKFTEKGNPKLDKDALTYLGEVKEVSIVQKILEYRKYEKLLNTYAVGIYDQIDMEGRVHGNINQTEATTGRMSITKPALQTLPKKDKRIRRIFIPDENYELWFMDLDQVEYRLFAHYAIIPSLIDAIKNGYDVHAATAASIFHIPLDVFIAKYKEGDPLFVAMRDKGKTTNFALIYGVGTEHLAVMLKCTETEAVDLKATYFSQLPEARTFIMTAHQVIKTRGFIKNFYGRRRRLNSDDCYKAPNALIQGCAADYIKTKLVDMFKYLMYHDLKTRLLLPIHDETILMVHKDEQEHIPVLRWLLSDFASFRCPITAGVDRGTPSWGQKETVDEDKICFVEPLDKSYLSYNVFDGKVFEIYKEVI